VCLQEKQDHVIKQAQLKATRESATAKRLQHWKDTANKLWRVWDLQQDSLVENFFALYQNPI
jgi:hypothetical protein